MGNKLRDEDLKLNIIVNGDKGKKELGDLEQSTRKLTERNKELRLEKERLIRAGKQETEEFRLVTTEITMNNKALKANETRMTELRKEIGLTGLTMRQLRTEQTRLKRLMDSATPGTEQWKIYQKELVKVNTQMGHISAKSKEMGGFFGKLQGSLGSMPGVLGSVASGFISAGKAALAFITTPVGAILAGIAAVGLGARALIKNSQEFGKAASSLSSITGATGKDLDLLKQKAKEISRESSQSAVDMLGAMEKIGSAMPALLKNGPLLAEVTKNAVALSESTGGKLSVEDAAKAAAAALNQFEIPLTESARAVNVLAAGSLAGSAEVDSLTESMKNIGPVASSAGMTLEQTVAALEVLGEKGIYAEQAGTKLRGAILKLQEAGVGYTSGVFNLKDALVEVNETVAKKTTAIEKDAYVSKLFGIDQITAGKILLGNIDKYDKLTKAVTGTSAAFDMARIQNDNLATSNKKISEAWKNMMLSIEDGNGMLSKSWKWILDDITKTLNNITSVIDFFKSKESKARTAEVRAQKEAEKSKRAELMATAKQLGLIIDEKISLSELETKVLAEQEKQKLETKKQMTSDAAALVAKQQKDNEEKNKAAQDAAQKALEIGYEKEKLLLMQQYADKEELQKEFQVRMLANELAFLKMKLEFTTDEKERLVLQQQIIDKENQYKAAVGASIIPMMKKKETSSLLSTATLETSKLTDINTKKTEEATDALDKLSKKQQKTAAIITGTSSILADGIYDMASGTEDAMKNMGKSILKYAIDLLKKQALIAVGSATVQSMAQADSVTTFGATGAIRAAILTGLIEAAASGLEGLVDGWYTGGYTEPGDKYEPAGIVHRGEFVNNQDAVQNKDVKQFLDVFDYYQRTGQIKKLNTATILASIPGQQMYSGGYSSNTPKATMPVRPIATPKATTPATNTELTAAISQLNTILGKGIKASINKYGTNSLSEGLSDIDKFNKKVGKK